VPDRAGPTGRIKIGTESEGGFKNIVISNCVFVRCRGLALETVDGGDLEDVTISNITMRDVVNSPIFLRLGSRMRAPAGKAVGALRRINISNVVVYNADPRYGSIVSGIPGHAIEDVTLNNIRIYYRGGGTGEQAALNPPENEKMYPEPRMFGTIPAYAFFIRHTKGIELNNVRAAYEREDRRPPFLLEDVEGATFNNVTARHATGVPSFVLRNVEDFSLRYSAGLPDTHLGIVERKQL
ncbi:MAG: rhamnogalacturonidase, partial [Bryobacteraceae bacterium]